MAADSSNAEAERTPVAVAGEWRQPIKRLEGFEDHHFVPPRADGYHNAWVGKIAMAELTDEIESLRAKSREVRGWKRKELRASIDTGEATLESPEWSFRLSVRLDPGKKGQVVFERRLEIPADAMFSADALDALFDPVFNRVEILPPAAADIPALIDRFEARGWPVDYPHDDAHAEFTIPNGVVRVETGRICIDFAADAYPGELLREASTLLAASDDEATATPLLRFS